VRNFQGALTLKSMASTNSIVIDGACRVTIDASSTAGSITLRGFADLPAGATGDTFGLTGTITQTARYATDQINAQVDVALNTAVPGSPTADSINERIVAIDAYGAPPSAGTTASAVWGITSRIITGGSVIATSGSVVTTSNLDKTNYTIAASGITNITLTDAALDAILDEPVEGALTMRQAMRIFMATLAGKSSGGGTGTIVFRNYADNGNRISASVDAGGNRTAISITAS